MRKILDFLRADWDRLSPRLLMPQAVLLYLLVIAAVFVWSAYQEELVGRADSEYQEELTKLRNFQTKTDFEHLQSIMDLSIEFHFDPTIVMIVDHHSRLNVHRLEPAWQIIKSHEFMTHLTLSLIDIESRGNTFAKSNKNAYGLTQFLLPSARDYEPDVTVSGLYDQETNIRIFFKHFERLLVKYNGNVTKVLDAWNRGEGTVDKLLARNINPANGYSEAVYRVAVANNRFRIGRIY